MQEWLLNEKINWDDIEFINNCGVEYTISDPTLLGDNDSGWCDAATGHIIPTATTRITFNVTTKKELTLLKLKFGDAMVAQTIIVSPGLPD